MVLSFDDSLTVSQTVRRTVGILDVLCSSRSISVMDVVSLVFDLYRNSSLVRTLTILVNHSFSFGAKVSCTTFNSDR